MSSPIRPFALRQGKEPRRRQSPPAVIARMLVGLAFIALLCAVLAILVWNKTGRVHALETQVQVLVEERTTTQEQLTALHGTATVMENRVAILEANDPAQQIAELQQAVEKASDGQQVAELRTVLADVQAKIDAFQASIRDLSARMDALERAQGGGALPAEARLQVAPQRQTHNLSCESSAASMVANFWGVDLSEADVLAALPKNANPNLGFRGNPDGPTGGLQDYGVYAGPIGDVLNSHGLHTVPVTGGLDGIRKAIARGNPVIAWVTYDMSVQTPVQESIDGQTVTLVPQEHVVVITGFGSDGVWANDPWDGREHSYAEADLVRSMGYLGNMALEVTRP